MNKKYLVMFDGHEIQIHPIMNRAEHYLTGTQKYYPYDRYLRLCKQCMKSFREIAMLQKATGLELKEMTWDEWRDCLENFKEEFDIITERRKRKVDRT